MVVMFCMIIGIHTNIFAQESETDYERDYLTKMYTSEDGLEGTVANTIFSSEDGFLWIGGYTGLYRYDGAEFKRFVMNGRALPINDIVQDVEGTLWIGTNGDGLFRFDGKDFTEVNLKSEEDGAYIINKLCADKHGTIWVGTKAGVFSFHIKEQENVQTYESLFGCVIHDICELDGGEIVVIEKTGRVFSINESNIKELKLNGEFVKGIPRCCCKGNDDSFYIGTTENQILKVSKTGEIICLIDSGELSSLNRIYEFKEDEYWICSDSGIGVLKNEIVTKMQFPLDDSVEEVCVDYQGNYWFASSRQGILQVYENCFSDLGSYWGVSEIVNSIQIYQGKTYVGCDNGLYCYQGKEQVEDALVKACKGERIRQIYTDQKENLWVSTYQGGIKILTQSGEMITLNTRNSDLTTNQIRCVWQKNDNDFLVGTEEGLFSIGQNGNGTRVVEDEILNSKRILDVAEDKNETIYAATDGYGVFVIKDGVVVERYSKKQGLLSGVILKVVPSEELEGVWIITGEEICFLNREGKITSVTGIPVANSLDLILTDNGDAVILAGNGFFRVKEKELLNGENVTYTYFNKQDGLPIDFTANSWNCLKDGVLYMCGTSGVASINLNKEQLQKPLRLYINKVTEDGKNIELNEDKLTVSANAHRINLDVRLINFVHQDIDTSYYLEKVDQKETIMEGGENIEVSYTNLDGGSYQYDYKVYSGETQECLAELSIPIVKTCTLWEQPRIQILICGVICGMVLISFLILMWIRERKIKKMYRKKYMKEKEEELAQSAYKDLVTGVYNRNCYERDKVNVDVKNIYAVFSISVNHLEYLRNKYGLRYTGDILRKAVQILQDTNNEDAKIYRVSERIFVFWVRQPVQLETYIYEVKEKFKKMGEEENVPLSFAVGAIYNNKVEKENIDELVDRCGRMRLIDEKHAEAEFIEGKMKLL